MTEANERIRERIKNLSKTLDFAEYGDLHAMILLRTEFEEIVQWAEETLNLQLAAVATKAAHLTDKIMLDEVVSAEASLEVLRSTVKGFQDIVLEGHSVDDVAFPAFPEGLERDTPNDK